MPAWSEQMVNWNTFKSCFIDAVDLRHWQMWVPFQPAAPPDHRPRLPGELHSAMDRNRKWRIFFFLLSHNKTAFWNKCLSVCLFLVNRIGQLQLQRKLSELLSLTSNSLSLPLHKILNYTLYVLTKSPYITHEFLLLLCMNYISSA